MIGLGSDKKIKNYDDIKVTILDQGSTRNGGSEPPAQVFTSSTIFNLPSISLLQLLANFNKLLYPARKYLVIITIARSGHHDTNNYGNWTWDTSGLELQWFDWLQDEPNDYHTQKYQRNENENSNKF